MIISAHEDNKIRYFDSNSGEQAPLVLGTPETTLFLAGRMIHSMVAHLDTVTSLAIDPQHSSLLSGST